MIDIKTIPPKPGVYIYKNRENKIIYIGKAINLKKRVSQYFQSNRALGYKTSRLVSEINNISFKTVGSEIEALILESNLIKQYRPKYNSQLKDDKSYVYISITKDKYPLIKPAFKSNLNKNDIFYGPFPDSKSVKSLLKTIRHIFPYFSKKHSNKPCLYCHLNICPGPNPNPAEYRSIVTKIKKILSGNFQKLIKDLTKEMVSASKLENYELAKIRRDQISSINYVISGWKNLNHLYQDIQFIEDKFQKSTDELKLLLSTYFPNLSNINRIEAYDISNLGKKYFVGSMTVFQKGKIDHSQYRQFKINTKVSPDDQYMIKEVIYRRLKHLEWNYPDLILVDGGKPQVTAAIEAIKPISQSLLLSPVHHNYEVIGGSREGIKGWVLPVIGLAKKFETLVIKTGQNSGKPSDWQEINLSKSSPSLQLLQQLRDEAHRFANRYRKKIIKSNLF